MRSVATRLLAAVNGRSELPVNFVLRRILTKYARSDRVAEMATESSALVSYANDAVANAVCDSLARAFGLIVELTKTATDPIRRVDVLLDDVDVTLNRSGSSEVCPLRRLVQLSAELVEPRPVFPRLSIVDYSPVIGH